MLYVILEDLYQNMRKEREMVAKLWEKGERHGNVNRAAFVDVQAIVEMFSRSGYREDELIPDCDDESDC